MTLLGFKRFLVPMILWGDPWWKFATIRALRKIPIKIGDVLHFYTGLRTINCEFLGVTLCSCEYKFRMHLSQEKPKISHWAIRNLPPYWGDYCRSKPNPYNWPRRMLAELAITDGFNSINEMWNWFRKTHGEYDQVFQRIEWKFPPKKVVNSLHLGRFEFRDMKTQKIKKILELFYPVQKEEYQNSLMKWYQDFSLLSKGRYIKYFSQAIDSFDVKDYKKKIEAPASLENHRGEHYEI